MLHDTRSVLAADYAAVDRVIPITFDISNGPILDLDLDPALARAHVAGGRLDLIPSGYGCRHLRLH